jgi:cardiolipin synthase
VNLPNILTALRFVLIPVFGYFLYKENYIIAVSLFLLGGITDVLDGYIARKYNMITSWGKLADPLADKFMQITALVLLTMQQRIPTAILIIVVAKEIFMVAGSILLYKQQKFVVSANWYGKMATVVFFFAIIMIIVRVPYSQFFIIVALLSTLFAFFMYSLTYTNRIKDNYKR